VSKHYAKSDLNFEADRSSYRHSLALKSNENARRENQQRGVESGCYPELHVCIFSVDCIGRAALERDLQDLLSSTLQVVGTSSCASIRPCYPNSEWTYEIRAVALPGATLIAAHAIFLASYIVFALGKFPGLKIDRPGSAIIGALWQPPPSATPGRRLTAE
jgi:hypothetical protein